MMLSKSIEILCIVFCGVVYEVREVYLVFLYSKWLYWCVEFVWDILLMIWWINEEVFIVDLFSIVGGLMFVFLIYCKFMYLKNK